MKQRHVRRIPIPTPALAVLMACFFAPSLTQSQVTPDDVQKTRDKLNLAASFFEKTWAQAFAGKGLSYRSPKVISFTTPSVSTGCGPVQKNNAGYCPADNVIYYDALFLTALVKDAAAAVKTDGDYAAIVAVAHEWGHAVLAQLKKPGEVPNAALYEEGMADCLAGAVTKSANDAGLLEPGDLEEARYSLKAIADAPSSQLYDPFRKKMILSPNAHGIAEGRIFWFNKGYNEGPDPCTVGRLGR
jgi:predicted metalloprotease